MIWLILLFTLVSAGFEPKNRVKFERAQIPLVDVQSYLDSGDYEVMRYPGSSYLCHIPRDEVNITRPSPSTPQLLEKGLQLIKDQFAGSECLLALNIQAGYWTVGYCFGDKIIQFHEDANDFFSGNHKPQLPNHVYVLGKFPGATPYQTIRIKNQMGHEVELDSNDFAMLDGEFSFFEDNQKYIKHTLSGEICDLTLRPRTIDIVYKCSETAQILEFQEIKTCQYQMVVGVPKLCEMEEFRKLVETVVDITCKSIEGSNEKLDLTQYKLQPMGNGIYIGSRAGHPNVAVSIDHLSDVQFGQHLVSCLERLPSPDKSTLTWSDTFVFWIELYDLFGNFVSLFRIKRDGSDETHQISIEQMNTTSISRNFELFQRAEHQR
ncbi:uncharacterized protein LODBEIA_P19760 [Lodderomyces beijingensis]|uniref:Endoplasmic reticulum lectin n=1 Tax=Lodderomyces beijingensis TaxID=1775926 RepID=A0ABP0ZHV5_9ASCO